MKKILIMCGTGVATSTIVKHKVESYLQEHHLSDQVNLRQSDVASEVARISMYDLVLSTTMVPEEIRGDVIDAVPLLTEVGAEAIFQRILECLQSP